MSKFGNQFQGGGYDVNLVPPYDFRPKQLPPIANANPSPPRWLKHQVYTDPAVFATIDEHAVKVARTNYDSFSAFLYNLVYSKNFTPLERLRIIYRWLTVRNLQTINFRQSSEDLQPGCPEDIVVGFRHRRSTYSKIFETLCLAAGIPCALVTGVAKGIEYRPGVRVAQYQTGSQIQKEQQYNHSWNAVFIDNSWQLVDVQWGTRFLQATADAYASRDDENLIYEYDDFYFMPDPSHLIYSHYPDDERFQLMPNPVSFDLFQSLPLAKSHFFLAELQFWSHNQGVITANNGSLKLSIGFWKPVGFTYKIWDADSMSQDVPNSGIPLHRYCLQEIGDGIVNYYIRVPYAGSFFFSIFCQRLDEMEVGKPAVYNAACEYKIVANRAATSIHGGPLLPYPDADSTYGYGSSLYYYQYGLVPSFKAGVIQASAISNDFELNFAKTKQPKVFFRLRPLNDPTGNTELPVDIRDTSQMAKVIGRLPSKGDYVLEVYANEPTTDGNQYTHIGQYLIVAGSVDLPEFKAGPLPPQSTPAGFARYPDSYELQSSKPYSSSKLVYHPSAAASSLFSQPKPVKESPVAPQNTGSVVFSPSRDTKSSAVTVHALPYSGNGNAFNNNGTSGPVVGDISIDLPAPPAEWANDSAASTGATQATPPGQQRSRQPGPSVAPKPFRQPQPAPVVGQKQDQPQRAIRVTFDETSFKPVNDEPVAPVKAGSNQAISIATPTPFRQMQQEPPPKDQPLKQPSPPKQSEIFKQPSPPRQEFSPPQPDQRPLRT